MPPRFPRLNLLICSFTTPLPVPCCPRHLESGGSPQSPASVWAGHRPPKAQGALWLRGPSASPTHRGLLCGVPGSEAPLSGWAVWSRLRALTWPGRPVASERLRLKLGAAA